MSRVALAVLACIAFACTATRADDLPRRSTTAAFIAAAPAGVAVQTIIPGGPLDVAGLRAGDIIERIGDTAIGSVGDYVALMRRLRPGPLEVAFIRAGEHRTATAALIEFPRESTAAHDVIYGSVKSDGARRRTIVTKPRGAGTFPAVFFIGGIGCFSIDNVLVKDDVYRSLAQALTDRGYVTMRVEKSGVGDSEGTPCPTVDLMNERNGYLAALQALKGMPFVDPANVFIFGHSIGGIEAPLVASQIPVRGIVLAEIVGKTWIEYELVNLRRQLELGKTPANEAQERMAGKERCMHALFIERKTLEAILAADATCKDHLAYPASAAYMQQVAAYDAPATWKNVDAQVLLLYGTSDFVTDASEHRTLMRIIEQAHPGHVRFQSLPNMDHYLVHSPSQAASQARTQKSGPLDPQLVRAVAQFLRTERKS